MRKRDKERKKAKNIKPVKMYQTKAAGSAACPGIKFIYIGKAEVESKIKALGELAFTGIKQLKGIRKIHHMEV